MTPNSAFDAERDRLVGEADDHQPAAAAEAGIALDEHAVGADQVDGDVEAAAAGQLPHLLLDALGRRIQRVVGAELQRAVARGRDADRAR